MMIFDHSSDKPQIFKINAKINVYKKNEVKKRPLPMASFPL
jgi:hypothetical protein